MSQNKIIVIIPTFNEFEVLSQLIESLIDQKNVFLEINVINAGQSLPEDLQNKVIEHQVPSNYFWGDCIKFGFEKIKDRKDINYVFISSADMSYSENTLTLLLHQIQKGRIIAAAPIYVKNENGNLHLEYSKVELDKSFLNLLHYREWNAITDAPKIPYQIPMAFGHALFPIELINEVKVSNLVFPHYNSDIDLWLLAKKQKYEFWLVPEAIAMVNRPWCIQSKAHINRTVTNVFKKIVFKYRTFQERLLFLRRHLPIHLVVWSVLLLIMRVFLKPIIGEKEDKIINLYH